MDKLEVFVIKNTNGMELEVSNFGATLMSLKVPNKNNSVTSVVVGLERAEDYLSPPYIDIPLFLGSSIGRYAGRISNGKFQVEGKSYPIKHDNGVHLHGGNGFDKKFWNLKKRTPESILLTYVSTHLEEGYPGELEVEALFEITENNCLIVSYSATTDAPTPVNLTCHPYFNLNATASVLEHELWMNSNQHLEVDEQLLPTGKIKDSKNTVFDYTKKSKINKDNFVGFDDTFILNKEHLKATLSSNETGIAMNVYCSQPAMECILQKNSQNCHLKIRLNSQNSQRFALNLKIFPMLPIMIIFQILYFSQMKCIVIKLFLNFQ
ncbi:aldose epimerase family protein [Flavobacterium sp. ZT3R25]|uniref:aldose epimerase family protein n=1 Tax=Flavobacterium galactosi TaxID=3398735 RepID=UPI003A8B6F52